MSSHFGDHQQVQLVAMDHKSLFAVVVYAYERVLQKRSDRALLHRGALSLDFRADPDEVNRLRLLQRGLRGVDSAESRQQADELEVRIQREHGADRSASALASMSLEEVLDAGVRWSVVGKRGGPVHITAQLIGLLERLYPEHKTRDGSPAFLEGTQDPVVGEGRSLFADRAGSLYSYRSPEAVAQVYRALSFVDRPTLDSAIDDVVGEGPDCEEIATWLEGDFELLTMRYEVAASAELGLHYRFS